MAEEDEIHRNKRPDKTYISRRIRTTNVLTGEQRALRIASKVLDGDAVAYAREFGEVVVRSTPKRRKEIVAKFLEDERRACPRFCVNGPKAGNCHLTRRHNDCTQA